MLFASIFRGHYIIAMRQSVGAYFHRLSVRPLQRICEFRSSDSQTEFTMSGKHVRFWSTLPNTTLRLNNRKKRRSCNMANHSLSINKAGQAAVGSARLAEKVCRITTNRTHFLDTLSKRASDKG